ncbi:YbaN family protein [Halomonas sp. HP20-15]|uniref:YbaN family protein n=1 Tax=Halomonas sp. HP20-15 TaxID=3085901 RepID=UPI002981D9A1|nr:YbaN family protein [Halomonas sp. HP20-15]MDW5378131.1 YbaN family protein [Halomonas sp. HP20-15]
MPNIRHAIYTALAGISFALGVIGLFLPVMPTTCFMLLAVWLASRGSPRFALWIREHPRFGPSISAWERERAIPRHAKRWALAMLAVSMTVIALSVESLPVRVALIVGLSGLSLWIATRPTPRLGGGRCPMLPASTERLSGASCSSQRSNR